ncbi:hypothetical protein [Bradyrhizobium sp. CSS354]|uniref:hypothetical protein n=1 Tax=Bradyrhizobium sp. CSS354 TaxID=2699172 RepID=UPI0023AFDF58|nr:hypothetical protein [Bradyrhizobium sp. CSS354]MDE5464929.1 hypothetical protein [Bradyrhizobium sp. CSS354]
MRTLSMPLPIASIILGATLAFAGAASAADTHVIGVQGLAWTYKDKKSTASTPLTVDDLKVGDIVEVQIPSGPVHHGFVTLKRTDGGPAIEDKSPVLACGEDATAKPNAVLRELDCNGTTSKFGVAFTGSLRLEVTDKFKDPVDFFCVIHKGGMPGVLKLAP